MRRYFTTFFLSEITVADEEVFEDYLFPEWGAIRFSSHQPSANPDAPVMAEMRSGYKLYDTHFPVVGPRTQEIRFRVSTSRLWSVILNPLGWARYVARPADQFANAMVDGYEDPAFAHFRPLADSVFGPEPDAEAELARIIDFLDGLDMPPPPNEDRILDIFVTLLDPQLMTVGELAERLGISLRTLERVCLQAFGFRPKLLLRRQRFMRSLVDYTLDPSLKWIGAMDAIYHDQAHFVRDFREFMGMTPSEYAAMDKPIMGTVLRERVRYARDLLRMVRGEGDGASG